MNYKTGKDPLVLKFI